MPFDCNTTDDDFSPQNHYENCKSAVALCLHAYQLNPPVVLAPDGAGGVLDVYDTVGSPAFIEGQAAWYSKKLRRQEALV